MPSEARFGVQTALRLKSQKPKATGIHPEKQKTQEFIGKNNNLSTVIPTKVGILIRPHGNLYFVIPPIPHHPYRFKSAQKSTSRHSHESGNLGRKILKKPFFPISFRADRSGFPPARE
ncbi:ubiquitin-activating enzyme [Neisseria gonorrhoeae]